MSEHSRTYSKTISVALASNGSEKAVSGQTSGSCMCSEHKGISYSRALTSEGRPRCVCIYIYILGPPVVLLSPLSWLGGFPYQNRLQEKNRAPTYSNLSTGGPRCSMAGPTKTGGPSVGKMQAVSARISSSPLCGFMWMVAKSILRHHRSETLEC